MIVQEPTEKMIAEWKSIWRQYNGKLKQNRKSGREVLTYLQNKYILTEIYDDNASYAIIQTALNYALHKEKLINESSLEPRAFFLENDGNGKTLYLYENADDVSIWGGKITRIFVGIEIVTGCILVEGSTMLWDELLAFQGLDEKDLENYVRVAEYINSLQRFHLIDTVLSIK